MKLLVVLLLGLSLAGCAKQPPKTQMQPMPPSVAPTPLPIPYTVETIIDTPLPAIPVA